MSMSPGVTYVPETSTTLKASAGLMEAATAATFPFAMATSRTALIWFLGSMTWPPFNRRSYCCCGCAEAWFIKMSASDIAVTCVAFSLMALPSTIVVPRGAPLRGQVLTHIERAGHRVARDGAGKTETQRVPVTLSVRAGDLNGVAVDGSGEIARDEIALMRSLEPRAHLLHMQRVV